MSPGPARSPTERGFFVTFEGGEGAGKSTQIARLRARLAQAGRETVVTREPGGSPRAEEIRSIILSGLVKSAGPFAELVLFSAARADHVDTLIRPALAAGAVVLSDRFTDSTRVYQGIAAGLPDAVLDALDRAAAREIRPDLTIVIDIATEVGLARAGRRRRERGEGADRFEGESAAYHERIRQGFLAIAAREPSRCIVVDGAQPPDAVEAAIWRAVAGRLEEARALHVD